MEKIRTKKKPFLRRHAYAILFSLCLLALTAFVLLDTFILPHTITVEASASSTGEVVTVNAETDTAEETAASETAPEETTAAEETAASQETTVSTSAVSASSEPVITENSYSSSDVTITITTIRMEDTDVHIADVQLSGSATIQTALANDTFGTNITQTTSEIAEQAGAILAINGDFYGANKRGYVIKNGILYRSTARSGDETEDLVIYADGTFGIIDETEISAEELIENGVVQLLAFGPTLVEDGEIQVVNGEEIAQARVSNPRTAIGIIDSGHYLFVVSDGRTDDNAGLSLLELAELMQQYGCVTAYNLDGGGSSTMVFNGVVVNQPTTSGNTISERAVSDIVYIGS